MRDVPDVMTQRWRQGDYLGERRPAARIVVRKPDMTIVSQVGPAPILPPVSITGIPHNLADRKTSTTQSYASYLWSDQAQPQELPNIKSVSWQRGVGMDVGTCTVEIWNTDPYPLGATPLMGEDYWRAGAFAYQYGGQEYSSRWGHTRNEWFGWLMPDTLLVSFEGYGSDYGVAAEKDPNLVQTGLWKIKDVEMSAGDRVMRLVCEDMMSLFHEQIVHPPTVPDDFYPLSFGPPPEPMQYKTDALTTGASIPLKITKTSNAPWNGDGPVHGHMPHHAIDSTPQSFWLSVGNAHPSRGFAYEYIEFDLGGAVRLDEVRFTTAKTGYTAYLSISKDGGASWLGNEVIGWRSDGIGRNGGNIPWFMQMGVGAETPHTFKVAQQGITHFRLTLGNLQRFPFGPYYYRGALREVSAHGGQAVSTTTQSLELTPRHAQAGNYAGIAHDWSDVIRMCAAWAGLYWPKGSEVWLSDGSRVPQSPIDPDPVLVAPGRVWGDIEDVGTIGPLGYRDLSGKSLYEVMAGVRDIVGYALWVDETGALIWRQPNLFQIGNWVGTLSANPRRITEVITLDENTNILAASARLTGRNVREHIFVGNPGTVGVKAHIGGWNPNPTGLRRVAAWCVDEETEVFTRRGWLRYDEVVAGDETLSLDDDGNAVWQPIKSVNIFPEDTYDMVKFEGKFDALVTPNHRWWVRPYLTSGRKLGPVEYVETRDLEPRHTGKTAAFGAAATDRVVNDYLVELVAWAFTDSGRHSGDRATVFRQSESKNPDKCRRIRNALDAVIGPEEWSEYGRTYKEGHIRYFHVRDDRAGELLACLDEDRCPTMPFLQSLTQDQLETFLHVCLLGDGHIKYPKNRKTPVRVFTQQVGPRLDRFLYACALAGVGTRYVVRQPGGGDFSTKPLAVVTLLNYQNTKIGKWGRTPVTYRGRVWCPSMPTYPNWLARRGGSVYYTGNTDQGFETEEEAKVMAEMVAIRGAFTYRTDSITIPAYPRIQIDDQVRVFESSLSEGYYHYVDSINSMNDLTTGSWTYDLSTHWLGENPQTNWAFTDHNRQVFEKVFGGLGGPAASQTFMSFGKGLLKGSAATRL